MRDRTLGPVRVSHDDRSPERHDLLIVENCIEKNFHVSNTHENGFVRVNRHACECNFKEKTVRKRLVCPKQTGQAYVKVRKSAQVDTLASQATKDVASCEKLGGAANER